MQIKVSTSFFVGVGAATSTTPASSSSSMPDSAYVLTTPQSGLFAGYAWATFAIGIVVGAFIVGILLGVFVLVK